MTEQKVFLPVSEFRDANPLDHGKASISMFEISAGSAFYNKATTITRVGWNIPSQAILRISSIAPTADSVPLYFKIETDKNNFLLKTVRSYVTEKKLHLATEVIKLLASHGLRAPLPISSIDGNFSFSYKGQLFSLTHFVDGEHFDGSRKQLASAAQTIASMHKILKSNEGKIPSSDLTFAKQGKQKLPTATPDELMDYIQHKTPSTEFDYQARRMLPELAHIVARITRVLPEHPKLLMLIHADLHAHNLLFEKGREEPVILDWDNIVWAQQTRDVGFASHRLSRVAGKQTERQFDTGIDWKSRMGIFLEEYAKTLPISDDVREAIPMYLQDEYITRILLILTYHFIDKRYDADPVLGDYILLFNEALALEKKGEI